MGKLTALVLVLATLTILAAAVVIAVGAFVRVARVVWNRRA